MENAIKRGRPLPPWFEEHPGEEAGDDFYLKAFNRLSSCRQIGMGAGPIPWDRVEDYGKAQDLDRDVMEAFHEVIEAMDKAFLEWEAERVRLERQSREQPE